LFLRRQPMVTTDITKNRTTKAKLNLNFITSSRWFDSK
jgi:hypothetical protein